MFRKTEDANTIQWAGPGPYGDIPEGATIPMGHRWWSDYEDWIAVGHTPLPAKTIAQFKGDKRAELKAAMKAQLEAGYVCPTSAIKMDATDAKVRKLDDGYRLAQRSGATTLNVRDYANATHANMALADVDVMVQELGANYQTQLNKLWGLQDQLAAIDPASPTAEPDIAAIVW